MEGALDYTYPKPPPTTKQNPDSDVYAYIPTTRVVEGSNGMENGLYHMVGPNHMQTTWSHNAAPPPIPLRNNMVSNGGPHFYHLLEDPADTSLLYDDPTLPTFRVCSVRLLLCKQSPIYLFLRKGGLYGCKTP